MSRLRYGGPAESVGENQDALAGGFARHRNLRQLGAAFEECLGIAAEAALARAC